MTVLASKEKESTADRNYQEAEEMPSQSSFSGQPKRWSKITVTRRGSRMTAQAECNRTANSKLTHPNFTEKKIELIQAFRLEQ